MPCGGWGRARSMVLLVFAAALAAPPSPSASGRTTPVRPSTGPMNPGRHRSMRRGPLSGRGRAAGGARADHAAGRQPCRLVPAGPVGHDCAGARRAHGAGERHRQGRIVAARRCRRAAGAARRGQRTGGPVAGALPAPRLRFHGASRREPRVHLPEGAAQPSDRGGLAAVGCDGLRGVQQDLAPGAGRLPGRDGAGRRAQRRACRALA